MLTKLEIKRQLTHIIFGLLIVFLLYLDALNATLLFALFIFGLMVSLLSKKFDIPVIHYFLKLFDREKDLRSFPGKGAVFYALGSAFAVLLFSKEIAIASILILAFGDSVSRLVGPYGYLKHPFSNVKFLEGVIAGGLAAFFAALFFIHWIPALAASAASMLIEGLDLRIKNFKIDDNVLIPVIAGTIIVLTSNIVQIYF